jgi:hypothetical protein
MVILEMGHRRLPLRVPNAIKEKRRTQIKIKARDVSPQLGGMNVPSKNPESLGQISKSIGGNS